MSKEDLLDLLSRLTIHMDNEIVRTTMISLTGIVTNFPSWRHNVTRIYAMFILRDIPDNCPLTLESALKFLIQMVTHWKGLITAEASQVSVGCTLCLCVCVCVGYSSVVPLGMGPGNEAKYAWCVRVHVRVWLMKLITCIGNHEHLIKCNNMMTRTCMHTVK